LKNVARNKRRLKPSILRIKKQIKSRCRTDHMKKLVVGWKERERERDTDRLIVRERKTV